MQGENNPRYSGKVTVLCDYCKKPIQKKPSLLKHTNAEGKTHNFCNIECYSKFRKMYYIGDKLYNTGKTMDESFCNKVRENTLIQYQNGILNRQTIPQKKVNSILDEFGIKYTNEKIFKYYSVDNYLDDYNLVIEVMGDYFHANPNKYNYSDLDKIQLKDVVRDKSKHTYIARYHQIEVLYLWENEINFYPELCKRLISKYIENKGIIENYNSFNFHIEDNHLQINHNIVNPYFITPERLNDAMAT